MDQESACIPVAATRGPQWQKRLVAAGLAVATGVVLAIAAVLTPDASGAGTHKQLGLPACSWISTVGMPCPTCGYTTSFTHAAHGDLGGAFVTQPFAGSSRHRYSCRFSWFHNRFADGSTPGWPGSPILDGKMDMGSHWDGVVGVGV